LKDFDADMGGTELFAPLNFVLSSKPAQGLQRHVFLLTDGAIFNT